MTTIWLNKCFKKPFKLKNSLTLSLRTHVLLGNAALSSCSHRFYKQDSIKQATREGNPRRLTSILQGQYYRIFQPGKDVNFSASARLFHKSSAREQEEKKPETLQELVETTERPQTAVTVSQKVAQAGKDVSYFAVILAGFAVTGALLWYVFSELFLSSSPNKIYAEALKKVKLNEEVVDALGEPIKAYGEETSRGRRRHVSFQEYIVAGENYMRVKFYVSGSRRKGTVHVDVKQVSPRRYEYRFIFVEMEGFPPLTIIIEDNRLDID